MCVFSRAKANFQSVISADGIHFYFAVGDIAPSDLNEKLAETI